MNIPKPENLLSAVMAGELPVSASSQQLFGNPQDEDTSDCPLLTPSPANQTPDGLGHGPIFNPIEGTPLEMTPVPILDDINTEDGLKAFMNIVNSSGIKMMNDGLRLVSAFRRRFANVAVCLFRAEGSDSESELQRLLNVSRKPIPDASSVPKTTILIIFFVFIFRQKSSFLNEHKH